jgi:hypothetical protein
MIGGCFQARLLVVAIACYFSFVCLWSMVRQAQGNAVFNHW